jgi:hypothetical protein
MNRVYEEHITFSEIFENEIICSDYYAGLPNGMKGTFLFVTKSCDTFIDSKRGGDSLYNFIRLNLKELFEMTTKHKDMFLTVSYVDIFAKVRDNFCFEGNGFSQFKVLEYEDEVSLDGVKEIHIKAIDQFDYLMNLVSERNNKSPKLKSKEYNELFTVKIYKTRNGEKILSSKINYMIYKGYSLEKGSMKAYTINTKENFNFFGSLNSNNFRLAKMTKIIRV